MDTRLDTRIPIPWHTARYIMQSWRARGFTCGSRRFVRAARGFGFKVGNNAQRLSEDALRRLRTLITAGPPA